MIVLIRTGNRLRVIEGRKWGRINEANLSIFLSFVFKHSHLNLSFMVIAFKFSNTAFSNISTFPIFFKIESFSLTPAD